MALSLTIKLGDTVRVGGNPWEITKIKVDEWCELEHNGETHKVYTDRGVEIQPNVIVSMGLESHRYQVKLSFRAPRSIVINREPKTKK